MILRTGRPFVKLTVDFCNMPDRPTSGKENLFHAASCSNRNPFTKHELSQFILEIVKPIAWKDTQPRSIASGHGEYRPNVRLPEIKPTLKAIGAFPT